MQSPYFILRRGFPPSENEEGIRGEGNKAAVLEAKTGKLIKSCGVSSCCKFNLNSSKGSSENLNLVQVILALQLASFPLTCLIRLYICLSGCRAKRT